MEGRFQLLGPKAVLRGLRQIIQHLQALSGCIYRTNHASNDVPLAGTLPKGQPRLLAMLDAALGAGPSVLRPKA